ncbi:hypothetical protein T281_14965 [Rhodomicrobium udaipurense JA643]|nr:hypothetical protein T281_14965 [Rhodomicrobium udaipurense JA643]
MLDVDVKNDAPGVDSLIELGLPFDTLTVRTPSGGWHLYYASDTEFCNSVGLLPGIDFKSAGGMVLGPGTTTHKGVYEVLHDLCRLLRSPLPWRPACARLMRSASLG